MDEGPRTAFSLSIHAQAHQDMPPLRQAVRLRTRRRRDLLARVPGCLPPRAVPGRAPGGAGKGAGRTRRRVRRVRGGLQAVPARGDVLPQQVPGTRRFPHHRNPSDVCSLLRGVRDAVRHPQRRAGVLLESVRQACPRAAEATGTAPPGSVRGVPGDVPARDDLPEVLFPGMPDKGGRNRTKPDTTGAGPLSPQPDRIRPIQRPAQAGGVADGTAGCPVPRGVVSGGGDDDRRNKARYPDWRGGVACGVDTAECGPGLAGVGAGIARGAGTAIHRRWGQHSDDTTVFPAGAYRRPFTVKAAGASSPSPRWVAQMQPHVGSTVSIRSTMGVPHHTVRGVPTTPSNPLASWTVADGHWRHAAALAFWTASGATSPPATAVAYRPAPRMAVQRREAQGVGVGSVTASFPPAPPTRPRSPRTRPVPVPPPAA